MTEFVTVLRCAHCNKPFSYVPTDADLCRPGAPSQICDGCYIELNADYELDNERYEALMAGQKQDDPYG